MENLNGHAAGNGGYSQGDTYSADAPSSTRRALFRYVSVAFFAFRVRAGHRLISLCLSPDMVRAFLSMRANKPTTAPPVSSHRDHMLPLRAPLSVPRVFARVVTLGPRLLWLCAWAAWGCGAM